MTNGKLLSTGFVAALSLLTACPKAPAVPGMGGGSGGGVDPDKCGQISTNEAGRKIHAFLQATAALDKQTAELEGHVKETCVTMGKELGLAEDALKGDTKAVCGAVADGIKANLQVGIKAGAAFEVVYQPAVCTVDMNATAQVAAECQGKAQADVKVACSGSCSGTCKGECAGSCATKNADGSCAGACEGTCSGTCEGNCQGSADVDVDAECKASAEVNASLNAQCTPPAVEVKYDAAVVVDATKVEAVKRALTTGLPELLVVTAKMQGVAKAFVVWSKTATDLVAASSQLASGFGKAAMCVTGQLAAAAEAAASIQVRVDVSVEASASVGGAASGSAG